MLPTVDSVDDTNDREKTAALSDAIDGMWTKFLPEIRARARLLEGAAQAAAAGALSEEQRQAAHSAAHKLAGTLGTFGLARGTKLARELEKMYSGEADALAVDHLAEITAQVQAMIENRKH